MNMNSESQNRRDKYDSICIAGDSVSDENRYEKNPERYQEVSHVKKENWQNHSPKGYHHNPGLAT